MPYDRDLIAERDEYTRRRSTIVKWWRVNYLETPVMEVQDEEDSLMLEEEARLSQEADEALLLAAEISARLEREAAEDEAQKQLEIAKALAMQENNQEDYNETTGSYSGGYGKVVTLDEEGLNQVDEILNEKKNVFDDLFMEMSE